MLKSISSLFCASVSLQALMAFVVFCLSIYDLCVFLSTNTGMCTMSCSRLCWMCSKFMYMYVWWVHGHVISVLHNMHVHMLYLYIYISVNWLPCMAVLVSRMSCHCLDQTYIDYFLYACSCNVGIITSVQVIAVTITINFVREQRVMRIVGMLMGELW